MKRFGHLKLRNRSNIFVTYTVILYPNLRQFQFLDYCKLLPPHQILDGFHGLDPETVLYQFITPFASIKLNGVNEGLDTSILLFST